MKLFYFLFIIYLNNLLYKNCVKTLLNSYFKIKKLKSKELIISNLTQNNLLINNFLNYFKFNIDNFGDNILLNDIYKKCTDYKVENICENDNKKLNSFYCIKKNSIYVNNLEENLNKNKSNILNYKTKKNCEYNNCTIKVEDNIECPFKYRKIGFLCVKEFDELIEKEIEKSLNYFDDDIILENEIIFNKNILEIN